MSILYNNILRLCEKNGISPSKMCVDLGISKNTISRLKKNEEAQISFSTAKKIADYFRVDVDCVLHGNKKSPASEDTELDNDSIKILELLHKLTPENSVRAIAYIQGLVDTQ